jgi:hypothetical protein
MPVATTAKDVIIDGLTIKVTTAKKTVTTQTVLHPKLERATLDKKEKHDVYAQAMVKHHKLFDLISLDITSKDKLDDTYNLEMLIEHMISSHGDYGMGDVFKIICWGVEPITGDLQTNGGTKDLYSDSQISLRRVYLNQMSSTEHMLMMKLLQRTSNRL